MKISRLKAARLHYEAKAAEAEETIKVYLTNAAGIGEHPQIIEEMDKLVKSIAEANDCLETLNELEKLQ